MELNGKVNSASHAQFAEAEQHNAKQRINAICASKSHCGRHYFSRSRKYKFNKSSRAFSDDETSTEIYAKSGQEEVGLIP